MKAMQVNTCHPIIIFILVLLANGAYVEINLLSDSSTARQMSFEEINHFYIDRGLYNSINLKIDVSVLRI